MRFTTNISTIVFLLLSSCCFTYAQDPVSLNCTEVEANGDVTIWWTPPNSTTGFAQYIIYFSSNGSSFQKIDSIDIALTNSYTHIGPQAEQGSRFYFIEIQFDAGSALSDTLQTIFLQLNNLNFSEAQLFWNAVSDPLPDGSSDTYTIYKEYPPGTWTATNTTTALEYSEPVIVCNDSINYRIEMENQKGCTSVSNVDGAWFKILDEPDKPVIDSISINEDEHLVIGWQSVGAAEAYIIYRFDAGIWIPVDTVIGRDNTFYEDPDFNPCLSRTAWTVATIDSCGNSGPKDENEGRTNLLIHSSFYDPCAQAIVLEWNNYRGPFADEYEVWVSEDNENFSIAGTNTPNDTSYVYEVSNVGSSYTFFVRAKFGSGTSTSCKAELKTYAYNLPTEVYFSNADILSSNFVDLSALVDTTVFTGAWEIWRTEPNGNGFSLIHSIAQDQLDGYPLQWTDTTANASEGYYLYRINVLDSCGFQAIESNEMRTIFLTVSGIDNEHNQLDWNAYEGWDGEIEKYLIFRMVNNVEPSSPFDSVDGQTFQYTDDLSTLSNLNGPLVYWVQAVEKKYNSYGIAERANSNRTGVALESEMFVANAFQPLGYTREFKPVFRFYNGRNYVFQVYNRWGMLIFETYDPYTGWDGKYQDNYVQQGSYIYRLVYQNLDDSYVEKKGTVTVVY
jgi:hypothetical protein